MDQKPKDILEPAYFFASTIYTIIKEDFLNPVESASNEALNESRKLHKENEIYPSTMSTSLSGRKGVKEFEQFIAESAWQILDSQGYNMQAFNTFVSELWCQEHRKYSNMEQHIHPYGVQLSGFYFINAPEEGCMVELHDPRPAKVISSLPAKDLTKVTDANSSVLIKPKSGMFIFTNSWLPHSFTRNGSDERVMFVHFNVSIVPVSSVDKQPQEGPVVI